MLYTTTVTHCMWPHTQRGSVAFSCDREHRWPVHSSPAMIIPTSHASLFQHQLACLKTLHCNRTITTIHLWLTRCVHSKHFLVDCTLVAVGFKLCNLLSQQVKLYLHKENKQLTQNELIFVKDMLIILLKMKRLLHWEASCLSTSPWNRGVKMRTWFIKY